MTYVSFVTSSSRFLAELPYSNYIRICTAADRMQGSDYLAGISARHPGRLERTRLSADVDGTDH